MSAAHYGVGGERPRGGIDARPARLGLTGGGTPPGIRSGDA
jgi:hypothetical protein